MEEVPKGHGVKMAKVTSIRRSETEWSYENPKIKIVLSLREAYEFGDWLKTEPHGNVTLGKALVDEALNLWELEGS